MTRQTLPDDGIFDRAVRVGQHHQLLVGVRTARTPADESCLVGQHGARRRPTLVDLTQDAAHRDNYVGEKHLVEMRRTGGLHQRPYVDARAVHVDEQEGDAVMLGHIGIRTHQQHAAIAELRGRVPHLLAIDHELVAIAIGPARKAGQIATGTRLAEELTPCIITGEQPREVFAPLLVAAVAHEGRPEHGDGGRNERRRSLDRRLFLAKDSLVPSVAAPAAVLTRIGEPGKPVVEQKPLPRTPGFEVRSSLAFVGREVQRPGIRIAPRWKMRMEKGAGLSAECGLLRGFDPLVFERGHSALRLPMTAIEVIAPRAEAVVADLEDTYDRQFERGAIARSESFGAFGEGKRSTGRRVMHGRLDACELRHERAMQYLGNGRAPDGLAGEGDVDVDSVVGEVGGDLFLGHLGPAGTELACGCGSVHGRSVARRPRR